MLSEHCFLHALLERIIEACLISISSLKKHWKETCHNKFALKEELSFFWYTRVAVDVLFSLYFISSMCTFNRMACAIVHMCLFVCEEGFFCVFTDSLCTVYSHDPE